MKQEDVNPEDLFDRNVINEVEHDVWAAVLTENIRDAMGNGKVPSSSGAETARARLQREGRQWLFSDKDYVGSFTYVCDVLNLDPGYVRRLFRKR